MKTTHNTQRVHSLHLTSSEGERRASPLRLRIDTMRTTSLLLPSTGYPWLWVYLLLCLRMDPMFVFFFFCRCWDTYLRSHSCCYGPRVYHASSTAKRKTKRQGQKHKTPLRMRVDGFADGGTRISHHNRAMTAIVYITLHPQGQNAIAHACGRVCRWWDTYITQQSCQDCYRVYHASSTAKARAKRHCACVWTGLQMVGHIYHTTIVPRLLSCISRFIHGKNKGKTPLRMRVDGFADGGTHISTRNRAKSDHLYIRTKTRTNAIAHACGRVCRWWDTYIEPQSC